MDFFQFVPDRLEHLPFQSFSIIHESWFEHTAELSSNTWKWFALCLVVLAATANIPHVYIRHLKLYVSKNLLLTFYQVEWMSEILRSNKMTLWMKHGYFALVSKSLWKFLWQTNVELLHKSKTVNWNSFDITFKNKRAIFSQCCINFTGRFKLISSFRPSLPAYFWTESLSTLNQPKYRFQNITI